MVKIAHFGNSRFLKFCNLMGKEEKLNQGTLEMWQQNKNIQEIRLVTKYGNQNRYWINEATPNFISRQ